jgi:hypothetical protein
MRRPLLCGLLLSGMIVGALSAGPVRAVPHGDWPCIQPRVPELSLGAFWSGPPLDQATSAWRSKPEVAGLVTEIISRRLPVEDAEKRIADFAAGHKGDKDALAQVFAGAFAELDGLRSRIVRGIERFTRSQRQLSDSINKDRAELSTLGAAPEKTEQQRARIQELQTKIQWATRLHHERESTLRYVCETPVILEQRVFAIARAVQNEM